MRELDVDLLTALADERPVGSNELGHALRALARAVLIEKEHRQQREKIEMRELMESAR